MALTLQSTIKLNSGYEMPRLGFGVYQAQGESCLAACTTALDSGYRHIDSAVAYKNEAEVGQAVSNNDKVKREDVFVTSKISSRFHTSYDVAIKAIRTSLENFRFDYIDLFLLHDPLAGSEKRLNAYRALLEVQKEGKIRSIGVSNFNVHHLEEIKAAGLPVPAVNQVELHPYCQQRPIVDYCKKEGIVVQAYSPLVRGEIAEDDAIRQIAATKPEGVDAFKVLIRWSLQKGFVPLPKSERTEKIKANADVYGFELSENEMVQLDALDKGDKGAVTWNPIHGP